MIFRLLFVVIVLAGSINVEAKRVHKKQTSSTTASPEGLKKDRPSAVPAAAPSRKIHVDQADLVPSSKDFKCPSKFGRYPLKGQCDKYIECNEGKLEEKLCPDGLVYNPHLTPWVYPCSYPIDVDCTGREKLQAANASDECPHQFGYFKIGDSKSCGQFVNCVDGYNYIQNCSEGLAFNSESYECDWPDQVKDCDVEAFLGFKCPPVPVLKGLNGEEIEDTRLRTFRSNANCQKYYLCLKTGPRLLGCQDHLAYDEETSTCIDIDKVDTCPPELRDVKTKSGKVADGKEEVYEPELDVRVGADTTVKTGKKKGRSLKHNAEHNKDRRHKRQRRLS